MTGLARPNRKRRRRPFRVGARVTPSSTTPRLVTVPSGIGSRRWTRWWGTLAALLGLLFALVPAVVNGGESPVADFGPPGRAVLVSLDTPASTGAAAAPTAGSSWAAVTVPASEQQPDGSLPDRLTRAIFDFVRDLATGRATGPDPTAVEVPVQGVAGSPAGSGTAGAVRFTGTSSPTETIAIGTPDDPAVVILCIIKVVTAVPAPATDPTTTTTTTEPSRRHHAHHHLHHRRTEVRAGDHHHRALEGLADDQHDRARVERLARPRRRRPTRNRRPRPPPTRSRPPRRRVRTRASTRRRTR